MTNTKHTNINRWVHADGHLYNLCWDWLAYAKFCRKPRIWAARNVQQALAMRGITATPDNVYFSIAGLLYAMQGMNPEAKDALEN